MKPRRAMTHQSAAAVFDEAVHEHALAVLSAPVNDTWQTFKCRFLERDAQRRFFVLDYQPQGDESLPELFPGLCVGVSFRNRSRKVLFASVVEAKGHFLFDDRTSIPAVRYRWPDSVTELQRRSYYRTPVPGTLSLLATLWPGGLGARTAAQGRTLELVPGMLADISCGGALVRLNRGAAPPWTDDLTLGLEIQLDDGGPPLLVNGHFRGTRNDESGQLNAAVQFVGLELSVDGRLVLQRLAACVQRLHRLSLPGGPHPSAFGDPP